MPVYNVSPWIVQCIESLKAQTFDGFECIVVDDGSTDGSCELAKQAAAGDGRFRVVSQRHSGLSAARNLGLDLSSSELVMYVDSDDYVLPDFVGSAVSFLEKNGLQMAFFNGDVVNCNSNPRIFSGEQCYIHRCRDYGTGTGQEMFCRMMQKAAYTYAVFLQIIRRDCIRHRFYDGILAQDKLYTTQNLLHLDSAGYLQDVLYIKRSRDGSAVSSKRGMQFLYSRTRFFLEMEKIRSDILVIMAGQDDVADRKAQEEFVSRLKYGKAVLVPQSRHETYNEPNDVLKDYLSLIVSWLDPRGKE